VEQQETGTVQLPLTSSSPDGRFYRLVGATLTINGPQTVTITDTSVDIVHATLTTGHYTVQLGGDWHLEAEDAPGTAVSAQLLSPNPLPFSVTRGELTQVRFLFKLPGSGDADVGIKVDNGGWIAGTLQFTERENPSSGVSPFDELVGKSVPFLISYESSSLSRESYSGKMLLVQTSPVIVQFGGAPSEILERVAQTMTGSQLFFGLRADSNGFIQFDGLRLRDYANTFELDLSPSMPFVGAVDREGFPAARAFQVEVTGALRGTYSTSGYDGVRGPANVNGLP
jgi:hypothetical protein